MTIIPNPVPHLVNVQLLKDARDARIVTVLGVRILFSYESPVGFITPSLARVILEAKHSKTTRRHIKLWIGDAAALYVNADTFPGLLRSELTKALRETPSSAQPPAV